MKPLSPAFQAHLDQGATTLCWCWAVARADGVVRGFTDHDRALAFAGIAFEASSGMTASEVQSALGLAVGNLTVLGALTSEAIAESDLAAGRYDGAEVRLWRVNWVDPAQRVLMRRGTLGEVRRGRTAFEAELRGLAHALNVPVGRVYQGLCDADLGDARCRLDLTAPAWRGAGVVTGASRMAVTVSGLDAFAGGWFAHGRLRAVSGANAGLSADVKFHARRGALADLELWRPFPVPLAAGDAVEATAGCDKSFATCRAKFGNGLNFRGYPHLPGNDALLATPKSGAVHDGKSRYGR